MTRPLAELLFAPRSVAVVGASSDRDKLSGRPLDFLISLGYPGEIYAVNPRRAEVQGVRTFPSIGSVPTPVDLAIVVVPAASVIDTIQECADAGVGVAIIFASGFGEVGAGGAVDQGRLAEIAASSTLRILGPNCLGAFSTPSKTFATFSTAFDSEVDVPTAPLALVSQSGAVGTFTCSAMMATGLGVSYFANPGNQCDLSVVELLTALLDDPEAAVLMGHLEDGQDLEALAELAAGARSRGKPLLVLKTGRTAAGARAVRAHTASEAGDDDDVDRTLRAHGALRVESLEEWADTALAFIRSPRPGGERLSIVTLSGGAGALAADRAVARGLTVDTWGDVDARDRLATRLPSFASVANPIDLTGSMLNDVPMLREALASVVEHWETDAVLVVMGNADRGSGEIVECLLAVAETTEKPFFVSWTGGSGRPRQALLAAGIPAYSDPVRAVDSLTRLMEHAGLVPSRGGPVATGFVRG